MFSQVTQISQAGLALTLRNLSKSNTKVERYMTNSVIRGFRNETILFSTPSTITSHGSVPNSDNRESQIRNLDKSVKLHVLKKTFQQGPGLKLAKNRDYLVTDFFNLTKSVLDKKLSVDDFVNTDTFKELQTCIEFSVDIMSNSQVVSLLSSVIKMNINPTTNLVKLLEHEAKFRLKMFNLNQIIKLFKIYDSTEISSDQKQLVDMLHYRMKSSIHNTEDIDELNSVLQQIASKQIPNSLVGSVEERLLYILTTNDANTDDAVMKYLKSFISFKYESLCNLFVALSDNKRRPTPILKLASKQLCNLSCADVKPDVIISTLNALASLSYPNRALITKLMNDLNQIVTIENLDSNTISSLLRSTANLRWKSEELLELVYKHIETHKNDTKKVDHNMVSTLIYVTALLNYNRKGMRNFYENCFKGAREDMLDKQSRKWLTHVWSLVALNIADEAHIMSVLNPHFLNLNDTTPSRLSFSDILRLLNIKAITSYEFKLKDVDKLNLNVPKIQRGPGMQKFADKIKTSLSSITERPEECLRFDIETPYGFNIDCECRLNDDLELEPIGQDTTEGFMTTSNDDNTNHKKCAIILVSYEDIIASSEGNEVVGHKSIVKRILKLIEYETVFLTETQLNRISESSELINTIKTTIKNSVTFGNTI